MVLCNGGTVMLVVTLVVVEVCFRVLDEGLICWRKFVTPMG